MIDSNCGNKYGLSNHDGESMCWTIMMTWTIHTRLQIVTVDGWIMMASWINHENMNGINHIGTDCIDHGEGEIESIMMVKVYVVVSTMNHDHEGPDGIDYGNEDGDWIDHDWKWD